MVYRTRTYIAGDWTGDAELITKLYQWNNDDRLNFHFSDAHQMKMARDDSLPCTIKNSLRDRLNGSKTFVLIVGNGTDGLTKGSCQFCSGYIAAWKYCVHGYTTHTESFVKYECEYAAKHQDEMKIVVIYNSTTVSRSKCPECIRWLGNHISAYDNEFGYKRLNYQRIKDAIM